MWYNVLVYTPYEGYDYALQDGTDLELKDFLLGYKGWLDDLTIVGDGVQDTDAVLKKFDLVRYGGKVKV